MEWMRWVGKALLLLSGFFLVLLGSVGLTSGFQVREIRRFGSYQIAVDLQRSTTVSILASDQPGNQLVLGKVADITTEDGRPPQRLGPGLMGNKLTLTPGAAKWANVRYNGDNYLVPVVIRAWASQGNVLNNGRLIVTDHPNRSRASFRFELSARNSIPTWQFLLGFALWFIPGGQLATAVLWGSTSNTGSITIAVPKSETRTIFYTYTGCTAHADYEGSFTLNPTDVPAGQAIVLNVQGWCGQLLFIGGVGNWARVSQAVAVPPDFHNYGRSDRSTHTSVDAFTFGALGYRVAYPISLSKSVEGPDDCRNTYRDEYPSSGGGINFVISGAGCDSNMWGAPGKPERSYTSMPTLTLYTRASPVYDPYQYYYDPRSGNTFGSPTSYRYSLSWTERRFTYRPSPYILGNASMVPVSSQLPDGTTVNTQVPRFDIHGHTNNMAIVQGNPIGVSLPDLIIPSRNDKCVFENRTTNQRFTVYLLDPPGTYSASRSGTPIPPTTYNLPAGARLRLPPGLYIVSSSSGNAVLPGTDLYVRSCNVMSRFSYESEHGNEIVIADISPIFFAY
jgi:hypothetical protein